MRERSTGVIAAVARRPRLAALLAAALVAFSGILYRYAEVSPGTASVFRCLYGVPLLALLALGERRDHGPLPRTTTALAVLAGAFFAADLVFWHHAIDAVGAGLATVLANLQVVIVGLVAWLLLAERPSSRMLVAVPVVLVGVVLISGVVGADAYGRDPMLGVVLGILTAVAYAGYLLVIRRGAQDLRRPAGPVAISTFASALVAAAAAGIGGDLAFPTDLETHLWLALYGVSSQSLGYILISLSLPRLPALVTSIILLAQPVMTVVLGMLLLAERPSALQLLGVVLVVAGIAAATIPGRARPSLSGVRSAT